MFYILVKYIINFVNKCLSCTVSIATLCLVTRSTDCWRCYSTSRCWQSAIFKPCVLTQFDAVVVYCSFLIPRSDGHRLTTLNFICLYIYNFTIMHYSNKCPLFNCRHFELLFMPGVSWQQWAIPCVNTS